MSNPSLNWAAISADPRFRDLHQKKVVFLSSLMIISVVYYFLLPLGAAYWPELFQIKVWGALNVGILFALSEFIVAWVIAFAYLKKANNQFDAMAREIINDAENIGA